MRSLTYCFSPWLVSAILLAGCGDSGSKPESKGSAGKAAGAKATTPEATLEAAKAAAAQHDYQALCQLLTPEAQEEMAAGLVMLSQFMQVASLQKKDADDGKAGKLGEKLREVLQKHGLNEKTTPKIRLNLDASPEEQAKELRKLAAPIKDHNAFSAEVLGVMQKYGDKPGGRLIEQDAKLKDLKIEGDSATATFVHSRNGKESESPIAFQKKEGEWRISKVPKMN